MSPTPAATGDAARTLEPYLAAIDNMLKELGPCLAQMNVLAPYLKRVTQVLERLDCRELLKRRQTPVVTPRPKPRVPTPTKPKQQTVIRYIVRKDEDGAHRESGAPPTAKSRPPREALGSDGSDTPPSEGATPRGQSPAKVDGEGTSQGSPHDGGSTDEADMLPTWPREATSDTHGPNEQPSDVTWLQGHNTVRYNWRGDLTTNTYKYEKLVEPPGPEKRDTPFTSTLNLQPIRALTYWIDEIHGRRGDAT